MNEWMNECMRETIILGVSIIRIWQCYAAKRGKLDKTLQQEQKHVIAHVY